MFELAGGWGRAVLAEAGARWALHCADDDADACAALWGGPLPPMLRGARGSGGRAALRLGPDEWLLLAPDADAAGALLAPGGPVRSVVDVSDRQVALELSGPGICGALNAGCPLDLRESAFPDGMTTRTVFGRAEVILWRERDAWRLEVGRSFLPHVAAYLREAVRDLR